MKIGSATLPQTQIKGQTYNAPLFISTVKKITESE